MTRNDYWQKVEPKLCLVLQERNAGGEKWQNDPWNNCVSRILDCRDTANQRFGLVIEWKKISTFVVLMFEKHCKCCNQQRPENPRVHLHSGAMIVQLLHSTPRDVVKTRFLVQRVKQDFVATKIWRTFSSDTVQRRRLWSLQWRHSRRRWRYCTLWDIPTQKNIGEVESLTFLSAGGRALPQLDRLEFEDYFLIHIHGNIIACEVQKMRNTWIPQKNVAEVQVFQDISNAKSADPPASWAHVWQLGRWRNDRSLEKLVNLTESNKSKYCMPIH